MPFFNFSYQDTDTKNIFFTLTYKGLVFYSFICTMAKNRTWDGKSWATEYYHHDYYLPAVWECWGWPAPSSPWSPPAGQRCSSPRSSSSCTYYLIFSKYKYTCMLTNLHSTSPFFFRKRRVRKRTCLTSHEQKSQQGLKLAVSKLAVILDSAKSMSALQYCIKDSTDIVWHKIVCGFSER